MIAWDLLFLVYLLLFLIIGFGVSFSGSSSDEDRRLGYALILLGLLALLPILNNFFGNQVLEATVYEINKTNAASKISTELSTEDITTKIEPSNEILQPYQVAVYPTDERKVKILNNRNSLWRLKFNKQEIQLQLRKGKRYRFRVYGLVGRKNILDIEEL